MNYNKANPFYSKEARIQRDQKVLRLICDEYTTEEIGKKLGISARTIETIRLKLMIKSKSRNVIGLLKFAIKKNIYKLKVPFSKYLSIKQKAISDSVKKQVLTANKKHIIKREFTIIKLICQENTSQEVADKVGLSIKTIDNIRAELFRGTNSKNVVGLAKSAIKHKIFVIK